MLKFLLWTMNNSLRVFAPDPAPPLWMQRSNRRVIIPLAPPSATLFQTDFSSQDFVWQKGHSSSHKLALQSVLMSGTPSIDLQSTIRQWNNLFSWLVKGLYNIYGIDGDSWKKFIISQHNFSTLRCIRPPQSQSRTNRMLLKKILKW